MIQVFAVATTSENQFSCLVEVHPECVYQRIAIAFSNVLYCFKAGHSADNFLRKHGGYINATTTLAKEHFVQLFFGTCAK